MNEADFNRIEEAPLGGARLQTSSGRAGLIISAFAGLIGAAGVALAAAGAHRGGGEFASLAANMMLIHAGIVLAIARGGPERSGLVVAPVLLLLGTVLFSGDLAFVSLFDLRPWPAAAPVGGTLLMAGWLATVVSFVLRFFEVSRLGRSSRPR